MGKEVSRAAIKWEAQEVGRTWMSPGKSDFGINNDIMMTNLPRSVSQGLVSSDSSLSLPASGRSVSPGSRASRRPQRESRAAGVRRSRSRSKERETNRKIVRQAAMPEPNLKPSSSSVSFSHSLFETSPPKEGSVTRMSQVSQSSSKSRGVLKDPRSTPIRSNSARLFLQEEQLRKLQENMDHSLSPESNSKRLEDPQPSRAFRGPVSAPPDSSVNSDDPVSNARLPPSRQFMNICAQELAKRKLIARAKASQEPDSTNLFGKESHYEVFAIEKKANGCTWGIRAYRPV